MAIDLIPILICALIVIWFTYRKNKGFKEMIDVTILKKPKTENPIRVMKPPI